MKEAEHILILETFLSIRNIYSVEGNQGWSHGVWGGETLAWVSPGFSTQNFL